MSIAEVLQNYIPLDSVPHCVKLWQDAPFKLVIKKKRESVLGDYRYYHMMKIHVISVNNDLNPFAFLLTLLHEIAHQHTQIKYGNKVKPHGEEWKKQFKTILIYFIERNIFPQEIIQPLTNYLSNPKATSCTDPILHKALRSFDEKLKGAYLSETPIGQSFRFNNRIFVKESIKRSRALCKELKTNRRYLISQVAIVEHVGQLGLFLS